MQVERTNGSAMALSTVNLNTDVYLVCLTHALSTEKEEIMGLLIGDVSRICVKCSQSTSTRTQVRVFRLNLSLLFQRIILYSISMDNIQGNNLVRLWHTFA